MQLQKSSTKYKSPLSSYLIGASRANIAKNRLIPQKQVSFGSAGNFIARSGLFKKAGFFIRKTLDAVLQKGVDQNFANAINYGGKALISPLMILAVAPFTDEKNESIKYSMLMQPLQAGLAFATSLGLSIITNNAMAKAAKKGTLGNFIHPSLGPFFKNEAYFKQFKSISTAVMTALVIPITSAILFWSLPKLMKKFSPDKEEPSTMPHSGIYAQRLNDRKLFCEKLRPEFGMLTRKQEK